MGRVVYYPPQSEEEIEEIRNELHRESFVEDYKMRHKDKVHLNREVFEEAEDPFLPNQTFTIYEIHYMLRLPEEDFDSGRREDKRRKADSNKLSRLKKEISKM